MREIKFRVWDEVDKTMDNLIGEYNSAWVRNILAGEGSVYENPELIEDK